VATRQQDGERRTEAHERRSFGKARGQRRWQHRRERGSRRAAENPGGEHPGEEEVKRGSGSRDRVTPAWCNGLARCENPQGRATASGTWRRAENFGSKREKRPGRRRKDGEGGQRTSRGVGRYGPGEDSEGESPRALRHETRPKVDRRNKASRG